ncbi:MAG: hypothetical protein AB7P04_15795 [Bacteriovoracia bacterium]
MKPSLLAVEFVIAGFVVGVGGPAAAHALPVHVETGLGFTKTFSNSEVASSFGATTGLELQAGLGQDWTVGGFYDFKATFGASFFTLSFLNFYGVEAFYAASRSESSALWLGLKLGKATGFTSQWFVLPIGIGAYDNWAIGPSLSYLFRSGPTFSYGPALTVYWLPGKTVSYSGVGSGEYAISSVCVFDVGIRLRWSFGEDASPSPESPK